MAAINGLYLRNRDESAIQEGNTVKSKIVVVVLLIILLTACNTGQATVFPSSIMNVATEAVLSQTPTLQHTLTPRPTRTPAPTFPPTQTIPASTLNAVATVEAIRMNLIDHFPELQEYQTFCTPYECYGVEVSPNGQLIYLTNFNTIDLFSVDGGRVGKYSSRDIYEYRDDYCLGYIDGAHWSEDERYLYVSVNPCGDGGPEPYFGYASALVRMNLENGTSEDTGISGSFEFSPNDEYIIYSGHKGQVQVKSLSTGQEQIYSPSKYFLYFGNYVWSPDDSKVVFVGAPEDWYANDSKFVIFMVDVESQSILQLYESSLPFYSPIGWVEADEVIVKKFNQTDKWTLDLSANPPRIMP